MRRWRRKAWGGRGGFVCGGGERGGTHGPHLKVNLIKHETRGVCFAQRVQKAGRRVGARGDAQHRAQPRLFAIIKPLLKNFVPVPLVAVQQEKGLVGRHGQALGNSLHFALHLLCEVARRAHALQLLFALANCDGRGTRVRYGQRGGIQVEPRLLLHHRGRGLRAAIR